MKSLRVIWPKLKTLLKILLLVISINHILAEGDKSYINDNYQKIVDRYRCVVCQNQSLGESEAPIAYDMRMKIKDMLVKGSSSAEIDKYFVERYGEFVLLKPQYSLHNGLLYILPGFGLLIIVLLIFRKYLRSK